MQQMVPLCTFFERLAQELASHAHALARLEADISCARRVDAADMDIQAVQALDHAVQLSRALALLLDDLAPHLPTPADIPLAPFADISLAAVRDRLLGVSPQEGSPPADACGDVDFF